LEASIGLILPAGRGIKCIPMMTSIVETRHNTSIPRWPPCERQWHGTVPSNSSNAKRKFRERINSWQKLIILYWPECPAVLAKHGSFLVPDHALVVPTFDRAEAMTLAV
jgi:hypothetical protein